MKAKEVLKILRVTRPTLVKYIKDGKLKVQKNVNGQYDYDDDSVYAVAGITENRKAVIYARVSTQKQKKDLENQIETIKEYANKNGYSISNVYSDVDSGLNYDRGSFMEMLNEIIEHKIKFVFVKDKDRLTRVSFNMWKELFDNFNCKIIVVNDELNPTQSDEEEIFSDIISLIHCFAMKMYSNRRKKKISLIEEDLKNEIGL